MKHIKYNKLNLLRESAQIKKCNAVLASVSKMMLNKTGGSQFDFLDLPFDASERKIIEKQAVRVRKNFEALLVLGIGGSDLGARAAYNALGKQARGAKLIFAGNNVDPDSIADLARKINFKRTAICVISKSGSTLETMSVFAIMRKHLIKVVGEKKHAKAVFVITDQSRNPLRNLAEKSGYTIIDHPLHVGGRFSVLSSVAMFPLCASGINIGSVHKGARDMTKGLSVAHITSKFALAHYLALKDNKNIHVLMPYADNMFDFALWWRQLWAESLGKDGFGPTPIAGVGVTDQHSQVQLYIDGPKDKAITFLQIENFKNKITVPLIAPELNYAKGKLLNQIMSAELNGTISALVRKNRPCDLLTIPKINEESIGALFMFFEIATVYFAHLLGVNAFDQPGVEESKKLAKKILEKT